MESPTARSAVPDDLPELARLYRLLETEMVALKPVWRITEGLPDPVGESFRAALADGSAAVLVGTYHDVCVGFLLGRSEPLLPQAEGERRASIRLIFTEPGFRELGVGEAMMTEFVRRCRATGHRHFDAHVSPGHRMAKNFFESNGFKARHIVMHHISES